jgi:hypothetical protein
VCPRILAAGARRVGPPVFRSRNVDGSYIRTSPGRHDHRRSSFTNSERCRDGIVQVARIVGGSAPFSSVHVAGRGCKSGTGSPPRPGALCHESPLRCQSLHTGHRVRRSLAEWNRALDTAGPRTGGPLESRSGSHSCWVAGCLRQPHAACCGPGVRRGPLRARAFGPCGGRGPETRS